MSLSVQSLFDPDSKTFSHLLIDTDTRHAAIVDPVMGFNPVTGSLCTRPAERMIAVLALHRAELKWILETHLHADHLSAGSWLRERAGGQLGIGCGIEPAVNHFGSVFNLSAATLQGDAPFDQLFNDGDKLDLGNTQLTVLSTPGHTASCVSYYSPGAVFVGDTLFMPDYGTARTDFPGGSAATLYQSLTRLLALPAATRVYLCHDYGTTQRPQYQCRTTIDAQRRNNIHLVNAASATAFVRCREQRDQALAMPKLFYPAMQFNLRGGRMPVAENNGQPYFKLPVRGF